MMIECEQHGYYEAIQVSPDLREKIYASEKIDEYVLIQYEYNNKIANSFYLSPKYAAENGLQNESKLPLPDDYPEWVMSLVLVCKKCFGDCNKE